MHCISKYTINGIFSMILNFNQPTILMKPKNLQLLYISILKNKKASGHSHILSTSLGCRRQPSLACHAWNHGKSPKSSPLSQQCRFHCHTWSAGESHYCVNSKGFMQFGTHTNEESDEYQQKWLPLSDFVGLCSKYIAIPYGSMAFILKKTSFQITRCF